MNSNNTQNATNNNGVLDEASNHKNVNWDDLDVTPTTSASGVHAGRDLYGAPPQTGGTIIHAFIAIVLITVIGAPYVIYKQSKEKEALYTNMARSCEQALEAKTSKARSATCADYFRHKAYKAGSPS